MSKLFIITESERNDIRKMYGLLNEQSTTVCTPFNANSKNLVYDYDQIINSYSALTNSTDINVIFKKINKNISALISLENILDTYFLMSSIANC